MTKTLTEQWKNGELGFGYYYIDFGIGGVPMLFNGLEFYCERTQKPNAIKTILAPVPSYDEYKQLVSKTEQLVQKMHILEKRLEIATKALKRIDPPNINFEDYNDRAIALWEIAHNALTKIGGIK